MFGRALALIALIALPVLPTASAATHSCSTSTSITSFTDRDDKTTFLGQTVGNLSALAVRGTDILALSDRSLLFTLNKSTLEPTKVHALVDGAGNALDAEGMAVDRDGSLWVSSEIGPAVLHYSADGARLLGSLTVPLSLAVAPVGGAVANGTFEGIALSASGLTMTAAMEEPVAGDSARSRRIQTWTRSSTTAKFAVGAQYRYRADAALGISDIARLADGRLLVLERGFRDGYGNTVRLYLADKHAHHKTLLADIGRCPSLGAQAREQQPNPLLDNIEGMTVTHASATRIHVLLISDDNTRPTQTTRFYRLEIRPR
jgi:hypothetical protein